MAARLRLRRALARVEPGRFVVRLSVREHSLQSEDVVIVEDDEHGIEIAAICCGRGWRADLRVHDERARAFVDRLRPSWLESAHWEAVGGVERLVHPLEHVTREDPLVTVHVRVDGGACVEADLFAAKEGADGTTRTTARRRMRITPGPRTVEPPLARATDEETIEVALRWILLWDYLGCAEVDQFAFWYDDLVAEAYVVHDAEAWLVDGAPGPPRAASGAGASGIECGAASLLLPLPLCPGVDTGLFVGLAGAHPRLLTFAGTLGDAIDAHQPEIDAALGAYPDGVPRARALIAVARSARVRSGVA